MSGWLLVLVLFLWIMGGFVQSELRVLMGSGH